ncbi:cilia- and flagella-associated protein 107-like [Urocitellus parryii]
MPIIQATPESKIGGSQFIKATEKTPQNLHRKEYVPFPCHKPYRISRWYRERTNEGILYRHLITHQQKPSHCYLISSYDNHYNRHNYNLALPALRTWSRQKLLWLPENVDFSLLAPPTNYRLYEWLKQQWMLPKAGWRESVYTSSYPRLPLSTMSRWEHAIPVPPPCLKLHF